MQLKEARAASNLELGAGSLETSADANKGYGLRERKSRWDAQEPRGSIYTVIRELGPKMPYYRRSCGSQFPNGCICGPYGEAMITFLRIAFSEPVLDMQIDAHLVLNCGNLQETNSEPENPTS